MFLSEKLYQTVISSKIEKQEDAIEILNNLYDLCSEELQDKIKPGIPKHESKTHIDRVFNSWDAFMKMLKKENHFMYDFINKYSFKDQWMTGKRTEMYADLIR